MSEKSISKTVVINIASSVILQGIAFLTTPYFSRALGKEQFGIYSVYNSWVAVLTCIVGLGVTNSLATGKYSFEKDYLNFRSNILILAVGISSVLFLVYLGFIGMVSKMLGFGLGLSSLLYFTAMGRGIISYIQEMMIYEKKPLSNLILSCCVSVSCVALSVVLINIGTYEKSIGRIYGASFPYIVIALIVAIVIIFQNPIMIKKEYCIYGFAVGTPIVFHLLGHSVLSQADRIVMERSGVENAEIGVYSIYCTVITALRTVLNAINTSWCPFYYDDLNHKDWNALEIKCKNYIELFTALTIAFVLAVRELGMIMGNEEYWGRLEMLPMMVLPVYFTFLYQFPVNFEFYNKKTKIIAAGTVGAATIDLVLNYMLIGRYGMTGAIVASIVSYLLLFCFHLYVAGRINSMSFHMRLKEFIPGIIAVVGAIVASRLLLYKPVVRWIIALSIGIIEVIKMFKRRSIF